MKDYATETDIIENPDPLFYPGDQVKTKRWTRAQRDGYKLFVESSAWDTLQKSWTYLLVYFLDGGNERIADPEVFEKELILVSRKKFAK